MNETNTRADAPSVYTPELIDLVRLGVAFVGLLERGEGGRQLTEQLLQLLPRLYAQTLLLPTYFYDPDEDYIEEYIREESYEVVRERLRLALGEADAFLVPLIEGGVYGSDCTQLTISECLADVYQHLGNLLGVIRAENAEAVPASVGRYLLYFREYWGRQLLLALPALHEALLQLAPGDEDEDEEHSTQGDDLLDLYSDLDDDDEDDL